MLQFLFQTNVILIFIKIWSSTTTFNSEECKKSFLSSKLNSERSSNTEDWVVMLKILFYITGINYILK